MGKKDETEKSMIGDVMLSLLGKDENIIKAKVFLNAKDHAIACDAYKNSRGISIRGELVWGDRIKKLNKYTDFKIIN